MCARVDDPQADERLPERAPLPRQRDGQIGRRSRQPHDACDDLKLRVAQRRERQNEDGTDDGDVDGERSQAVPRTSKRSMSAALKAIAGAPR
jgi:hypothetical protein